MGSRATSIELADGTLLYTRTESAPYPAMDDPPEPWGSIYYRNTAVASTDGGRTWQARGVVTDAPYHGDCEVGMVELEPGHLLAMTRVGFGGGKFGQPSRLVRSYDSGHTWSEPSLTPVYGQRTMLHRLQSGKLLVTYRNRWGTPCSRAFLFHPEEEVGFEPASFIWEQHRCTREGGEMLTTTGAGRKRPRSSSRSTRRSPAMPRWTWSWSCGVPPAPATWCSPPGSA